MTDALADRCSLLGAAMVPLMSAAITSQGDPKALADVLDELAKVRAVVARGTAGVSQPDYLSWVSSAPGLLDAMEAAAKEGDAGAVWRLFTDREIGFHKLGTACAGQPGW
jgi:hypothetical protein